MYKRYFKRALDIVGSGLGLILLFPVLFGATILTWIAHRGRAPIFFVQRRPGRDNRLFPMLKFCTMTNERDAEGKLLPDEKRLTDIGKFLRKTSIDELPQLINVLRGEMSLIGPRPQLQIYIDRCNSYQRRRQEVRPGISGLAQVKGRNLLKWEHRFRYDVFYVDNVSLKLDAMILLATIFRVFGADGVEYEGAVADNVFLGTPHNDKQGSFAHNEKEKHKAAA